MPQPRHDPNEATAERRDAARPATEPHAPPAAHVGPWLRRLLRTGVVDLGLWTVATVGAFSLLQAGTLPPFPTLLTYLAGVTVLKLFAALAFGLHRHSWRKFAFEDAAAVVVAMAAVSGIAGFALLIGSAAGLSPTVAVLDGLLSVTLMLGARGGTRYLDENFGLRDRTGGETKNVLMIGAGEAGAIMAREMLHHPETGMRPIGFLDDDPEKRGGKVASVPVLGDLSRLETVLDQHDVHEVLICVPTAGGTLIRDVVERVRRAAPDVTCRTMPALYELISGKVQISRIRDVTIDDLLRRPTVKLDTDGVRGLLHGKRVMVTGAGGSIGSELVRQICAFEPAELILFGHGENSIYQLERELDVHQPHIAYTSVIAQVQNGVRLESVFQRYRPEAIFHTAAHKHVPLMEANPEEAIFNNVVGSRNLIELAVKYGVKQFVNVSTDKAVNPTSVMGATKRIVEMIVETASRRVDEDQTFLSVRFGNVLGSRGSAVPLFLKQIAAGGPVTVTDPDMVRYFMTIPEASRLVLQATAQGRNGNIYILDMGEPVKIVDLVTDLIRLSGLEPHVDVPIVFTGKRPGEKMYEELMTDGEAAARTTHAKIFVANAGATDAGALRETIEALTRAALTSDGDAIRRLLTERIHGAHLTSTATPTPPVTGGPSHVITA